MSTGGELAKQTVERTEQAANAQGDRAGYALLRNEYEETLKSLSDKRDAKALEGVNLSNYAKRMDDRVAQDEKFLVFGGIWANENADKVEKAAQQKGIGNADGKLTQEELAAAYNDESMSKFDRLMIRQLKDNFKDFAKKGDDNKNDISKEDASKYLQANEKTANGTVFKTEDDKLNLYKLGDGTFLYKSAVTNSWKHIEPNGIERKADKPIKDVKANQDGSFGITFDDDSKKVLGADGKFVEAPEKPKDEKPQEQKVNDKTSVEVNKEKQVTSITIDGKRHEKQSDGTWKIVGQDPNTSQPSDITDVKVESAEGKISKVVVSRKDSTEERFPDGHIVKTTGETSEETYPDGRVIKKDKNGATEVVLPKNNMHLVKEKDGWVTVGNDGQKKPTTIKNVTAENGIVKLEYADKTETYGADGRVETDQTQEQKAKQESEAYRTKSSEKALVKGGEGYYQSAERILKEVYGIQNAKPRDVLALARFMRDTVHGGNRLLKQGQQLISADNWQQIEGKIREIQNGYTQPQQLPKNPRTEIEQ